MNMTKNFTEKEAKSKYCPFVLGERFHCVADACISWQWIEDEVRREDHSGGDSHMRQLKFDRRNPELRREGPSGSSGVWILDARGTCRRLP